MMPILLSLMVMAFATYLAMKGLSKIWKIEFKVALGIGATCAVVAYFLLIPAIAKQSKKLTNDKPSINTLFTLPLIFCSSTTKFCAWRQ